LHISSHEKQTLPVVVDAVVIDFSIGVSAVELEIRNT
jgi:hypothetical protein